MAKKKYVIVLTGGPWNIFPEYDLGRIMKWLKVYGKFESGKKIGTYYDYEYFYGKRDGYRMDGYDLWIYTTELNFIEASKLRRYMRERCMKEWDMCEEGEISPETYYTKETYDYGWRLKKKE